MIPLVWFLAAWLFGVLFIAIVALLTTSLALRFGLSGSGTLVLCGVFLAGLALILLASGSYLLGVDWSQTLSFGSSVSRDTLLLP